MPRKGNHIRACDRVKCHCRYRTPQGRTKYLIFHFHTFREAAQRLGRTMSRFPRFEWTRTQVVGAFRK